ncbi:sigma factor-like helix-turn-helix DNA-binding protein [Staphylococcus coagulans]|uniref:Sigma-70 family RNA polymerase sigma factor n=1 Tax=Staphylococcus coagulans TaxID=74706 RepID=A0A9X0TPJ0_9STAP|nr:sigma factor-like helix-turn-helix DNA-binding protein [Staphylococcus coagulans]MBA8772111.1 sigma-70 family RNA polymerase sigma factor [Staphylococcus coagulans]MBA8777636.1 sigma-70 family RNA polymerase sigma factor [Staphylococcus coagulans]MDR9833887.1 sigma factor-like helix-turn-helix DNA-binding protein [Staphylococcus coagulans]
MIELIEMYRTNKLEIESLKLRKDICNDEIDNWGAVDSNVGRLGKKHDFLSRIKQTDNVIEELNVINDRLETLQNRQNKIIEVIDKFEGLEHKILRLRFIDGYKIADIAEELGYSEQYIRNKHSELMKRIEFKMSHEYKVY